MVDRLPPEYLPAEERPARIAELERQVAREWLRFAITEAIVVWVPFGAFLVAFALTDAISDDVLAPVAICAGLVMAVLVTYWMVLRIQPLTREIAALKELESRG